MFTAVKDVYEYLQNTEEPNLKVLDGKIEKAVGIITEYRRTYRSEDAQQVYNAIKGRVISIPEGSRFYGDVRSYGGIWELQTLAQFIFDKMREYADEYKKQSEEGNSEWKF